LDFLASPLFYYVGGSVISLAHHNQHATATGGMRDAYAVLDVRPAAIAILLSSTREPLRPVRMIDRVVCEHP
jgi:hypothetical protein